MSELPADEFRNRVYQIVDSVPHGRVITYGDIALLCGRPYASRQVGGIAHFGPTDLPWHRVVNRHGGLASGYEGGKQGHQVALEAEGVAIVNYNVVNFDSLRWRP